MILSIASTYGVRAERKDLIDEVVDSQRKSFLHSEAAIASLQHHQL